MRPTPWLALLALGALAGCVIDNPAVLPEREKVTLRLLLESHRPTATTVAFLATDATLGVEVENVTLAVGPASTGEYDTLADPSHDHMLVVTLGGTEQGSFRSVPAGSCHVLLVWRLEVLPSGINPMEASCNDAEFGVVGAAP